MENTVPRKPKRRARRWLAPLLVVALLVILAGIATVGYLLALQPVSLEGPGQSVVVEVKSGQGASAIGRLLQEKGLLRHGWAFAVEAYRTGRAGALQAGLHALSTDLGTEEIVAALADGSRSLRSLTFPEGYEREQMGALLEKEGVCSLADFLGASSDEAVQQALGVPVPAKAGTAEGYMFPDTYYLRRGQDPAGVVAALLQQFKQKFLDPLWTPAAAQKPWGNLHQVVTLASLVEREAKLDTERARIAGVLVLRLRKGMALQCDATVQYALGQHKPRLTYADLKVDSPYNTYKFKGLPPGPICCPGLKSLEAALHPQVSDALFYVAKPDGSHVFSRTYEEHLAAIKALRGGR